MYYSLITTICFRTKVKFTSTIDECKGNKPINICSGDKDKSIHFNFFDTLQQAEAFREHFFENTTPVKRGL